MEKVVEKKVELRKMGKTRAEQGGHGAQSPCPLHLLLHTRVSLSFESEGEGSRERRGKETSGEMGGGVERLAGRWVALVDQSTVAALHVQLQQAAAAAQARGKAVEDNDNNMDDDESAFCDPPRRRSSPACHFSSPDSPLPPTPHASLAIDFGRRRSRV
uniref:Uncharacterized protein n=1 Tax=Oryza sativa subsp. japonica TaxID=39947 RepID=Q10JY4_ORYSJ|nr:hypothetical protein LOC_Os03g29045 [Oryza sativa Japonica Group]